MGIRDVIHLNNQVDIKPNTVYSKIMLIDNNQPTALLGNESEINKKSVELSID